MSYDQQWNNERNENKDIRGNFRPSKVVEFVSKSTFGPLVGLFRKWYEEILVFGRAIAVSLDPLFFYVPVIKEEKKCIDLNKVLWNIAVVSRSVTDAVYLVYFVAKSNKRNDELDTIRAKGRRYSCSWFIYVLNILVILPIPQVVMSSLFSAMRSSKFSNITILNSLIFLQYGPRVFQIYRSWMKLLSAKKSNKASLWIKASLNLFLYILAGHVLGAFWYFFSTQRLMACWHKAIENRTNEFETFNCRHSSRNLSFIDDFCPIDSPNLSTFNFGIFLEARRSGILESTSFLQKAFYCFWWGMRNLSSFGSNLQTSKYIWENIFALGISIFGLLLFLYFIGNLQIYMQDSASESIKKSDVGNLLITLEKLYKQRASESIKKSERDKNPALDDAVVGKLETELRQLYKQCIASKSKKDAVLQKSDVGNLLIKLGEIYKQPASKSIGNSETDENPALDDAVVEKLGRELGQLYKQCKDAVQPKSEAASTEIGWCCC